MVHKYKTDANNQFLRVKSRICPHGFKQIEGLHYDKKKVASPTAHLPDVLLFLATTCQENMHLRHYDVKSAFSIPELKERIVMKFPVGMNKLKGKTVLLKNSLNGLKQAARNWYDKAHEFMTKEGFKRNTIQPCLYTRWTRGKLCMVCLYVDNFNVASADLDELDQFRKT